MTTTTSTLTSLAILNVYVNQGLNYLDYLRPFILHVLIEHRPDPVKSDVVSGLIHEQFGLEIPYPTVEMVLKRISRSDAIKRENHLYRITGDLPDPQITTKARAVKGQIDSVVTELVQYSQNSIKPFTNSEHAMAAIGTFLSSFDVTCLKAALRETAIPKLEGNHISDIVQVSEFVQHLQRTSPMLFQNFLVLLQGNMAANALLCPDLQTAPPRFQSVQFYLDTPLLIRLLGLEADLRRSAMRELVFLLAELGGTSLAFSHTLQELRGAVVGAANYLNSTEGRGSIVFTARERGTERAELMLISEKLEEELAGLGVHVEETPRYEDAFQIDESVFEVVLKDEVKYYNNPKAVLYDINSVRSIYAIRGKTPAPSLEKASAVLVTSNSAFAKAAWVYGQQYESSQDVSVVITEFSLANLAWLKSPMAAPTIPKTQLLAFSYAALMPSSRFLDKFMAEVDKLESRGNVAARDLQLLRSSPQVISELMHLTLGEDTALTGETLIQTLNRVTQEIKKEETAKIVEEQDAHQETQASLSTQLAQNKMILNNIRRRCLRNAKIMARTATTLIGVIFLMGLYAETVNVSSHLAISRILVFCTAAYLLLSAANVLFNFNFLIFHNKLQKCFLNWLLRREAKAIGVTLSDFDIE